MSDKVNHPDHYQSESGIEVFDVIEAFTDGLSGASAFYAGNVIKYICRFRKKNGYEDLQKAAVYLQKLMDAEAKEVRKMEIEKAKGVNKWDQLESS